MGCYVAKGDLPLTIRWYFHGKDVSHVMGVTTMKVGGRSNILSISSATHGHSGEYTCDASNAAGRQRYSASLTVHGTITGIFLSFNGCWLSFQSGALTSGNFVLVCLVTGELS